MQERVLKTLEYDKILDELKLRASCCIGRELAETLSPSADFDEVQRQLTLTGEAETLVYRTGQSPVDDFPDMRQCLKRMHAALFISPGELLGIAKCLRAARVAREVLTKENEGGLLYNMASFLTTHRSVEEEINRCIISEDEIFDGASPALSRIRRAMRAANERVRERLNTMIRSATYQKYLQEPIITIRNGRFVIPVKQEYRQQVPGLVHDQSGSGATLFIEPTAVVELGNEYKKLLAEEAEEVERILAELTAMVEPYADEIYEDLSVLGEIDLVFAKARLSREMNCICPKLNRTGYIRIVRGRHPLIPRERVVPVDIWLGKEYRSLIITGPNTGGKTVTLKLVGLFTLMAQSGMFIPAAEGSECAVFDAIYADIGDEQSIEQSLSTFSSHMKNIVEILKGAARSSPASSARLRPAGGGSSARRHRAGACGSGAPCARRRRARRHRQCRACGPRPASGRSWGCPADTRCRAGQRAGSRRCSRCRRGCRSGNARPPARGRRPAPRQRRRIAARRARPCSRGA